MPADDPVTIIEAAIERLRDDVGAIVEPAVITAFFLRRPPEDADDAAGTAPLAH